jgi:sulfane dehydrogenase subunit SoxC
MTRDPRTGSGLASRDRPHDALIGHVRRRFILGSAAAASGLAAWSHQVGAAVPPGAIAREVPADPSKVLGYPLDDESYGSRSQFETEVRTRYKTTTP